jgi:hypothetical protein
VKVATDDGCDWFSKWLAKAVRGEIGGSLGSRRRGRGDGENWVKFRMSFYNYCVKSMS